MCVLSVPIPIKGRNESTHIYYCENAQCCVDFSNYYNNCDSSGKYRKRCIYGCVCYHCELMGWDVLRLYEHLDKGMVLSTLKKRPTFASVDDTIVPNDTPLTQPPIGTRK
jgi:hypothetical protein